jgi:3-oxochol-4-en-24-oyl-CoA dehydrogenase
VPIATTSDQFALQASLRDWAKQAAPLAAVRRLEPGAPVPAENGYLSDLAGLGLFSIAVPEAAGGAGGTLTDLAAALEQLTVALVPGPVLPTALAGLLLASANATALPPALAAGQATAAVALTPGRLAGGRQAGGTLRVTGQAGPVLGAGTTSHLLLGTTTDDGEAWFWITAGHPALAVTPRRPRDFSRSLADVTLTDAAVPEGQLINGLDTARVRDLAATTCAAEAAGVAACAAPLPPTMPGPGGSSAA